MPFDVMKNFRIWLTVSAAVVAPVSFAEVAAIAVASNFTMAANQLVKEFEIDTDHDIRLIFGSSGRFFAQITNGAPFDIFLSADQEKPAALVENNLALANSLFTYAIGALVLWSSDEELVQGTPTILGSNSINKLAIANSRLAPYGVASEEVIINLNLMDVLQPKLIRGENISQTFQFVSTGNAQLGFVSASQVYINGNLISGSAWDVPANLHGPIMQDAVLLRRGDSNSAAVAFMRFLISERGQEIIETFGYRVAGHHGT